MYFSIRVGVSICLDRVSIKKSVWKMISRQSWFSWQFEKWHLDKSCQSLCYKVLICLDFYLCLDRVSQSRNFKNWHLDSLKMDISTYWDISISITIALNCREPPGLLFNLEFFVWRVVSIIMPFDSEEKLMQISFWMIMKMEQTNKQINK